jgi:hypothetical protein
MTTNAIITAEAKRRLMDDFKADADLATTNYYIGISKSEDWNATDTAPTPLNTEKEQRDFRHGLQSVKKVVDFSAVVPRVNWTAGQSYNVYNDTKVGHPSAPNQYYVVTANNSVYVCIRQGRAASDGTPVPSENEPTGSSTKGVIMADGYGWKFLYTIGTLDASKYKSANFIPVKLQGATDGSSPATDVEQLAIQNAAVSGAAWNSSGGRQIVGIDLDSGGSGYSSVPTIAIVGDGDLTAHSGAHATALMTTGGTIGSVVNVKMNDDSAGAANLIEMGQGFSFASVTFSGGSPTKPAVGKVIFGPQGGFGADPRDDLRADAMMFNAKPNGNEEGEFQTGNSFRQIGLIRNPKSSDSASAGGLFSDNDGSCLRRLQFASIGTAFTQGALMKADVSEPAPRGYVDSATNVSAAGNLEVFYHQTESTGFTQFSAGQDIVVTSGSGAGTVKASNQLTEAKVEKYSGDLLYIDNRAAVVRAADQTEDIKVIIEI